MIEPAGLSVQSSIVHNQHEKIISCAHFGTSPFCQILDYNHHASRLICRKSHMPTLNPRVRGRGYFKGERVMPFRIGPLELVIILTIVILLFGVGRIGRVAGELGSGIRSFREGLKGDDDKEKKEEGKKEDSE
jgi:sec-independent protein translocase protein TatA